jgi:hypothetical protein
MQKGNTSSGSAPDRSLRRRAAVNYAEGVSGQGLPRIRHLAKSPPRALSSIYDKLGQFEAEQLYSFHAPRSTTSMIFLSNICSFRLSLFHLDHGSQVVLWHRGIE